MLRSTSPSLGFYLAHGDGTFETPTAQMDLPRGRWARVSLDFWFGAAGSLKLQVDGMTAWDAPLVTAVPATPELRVGVQHYNGATPAFSALFDTVRADLLH